MLIFSKRMLLLSMLVFCSVAGAGPTAADGNLDQRISELERELDALKREVTGAKGDGEAAGLPQVAAGDKKNLTFTGGMRIQTRYAYHGPLVADGHNFRIKRLRLKGKGEVLGIAKYYAEFKFEATTQSLPTITPEAENAWVEFNTLPHTNLRIGLYDIPFSRNALTSDSKLLIMDRSLIKMLLDDVGFADNTIGALFHEVAMDGRLAYAVGVFENNKLSGGLPTIAGRFTLHLLDLGKKPGSRGSYANYRGSTIGEGRRLDIGANVAYTPDAMGAFDLYAVGGDVFFNSGPFTLQGEYDWYRKSMTSGDVDTRGGYVQAGVLLDSVIERVSTASWVPPIELAARYQDVDSEDVFSPGRRQAADVGINFYIRDHNLKVQTTYTVFDKEIGGTSHRYQLQLQLDF